jgi:hypothetical protein
MWIILLQLFIIFHYKNFLEVPIELLNPEDSLKIPHMLLDFSAEMSGI